MGFKRVDSEIVRSYHAEGLYQRNGTLSSFFCHVLFSGCFSAFLSKVKRIYNILSSLAGGPVDIYSGRKRSPSNPLFWDIKKKRQQKTVLQSLLANFFLVFWPFR